MGYRNAAHPSLASNQAEIWVGANQLWALQWRSAVVVRDTDTPGGEKISDAIRQRFTGYHLIVLPIESPLRYTITFSPAASGSDRSFVRRAFVCLPLRQASLPACGPGRTRELARQSRNNLRAVLAYEACVCRGLDQPARRNLPGAIAYQRSYRCAGLAQNDRSGGARRRESSTQPFDLHGRGRCGGR